MPIFCLSAPFLVFSLYAPFYHSSTYELVVTNRGPNTAKDVVLMDQLPAEVTAAEYSADNGTTWQPWPGTYAVGDLAANATRTLVIRGTVSPSATGSLTNSATLRSPTDDPDPKNNTSTVITQIIPPTPPKADLSVTKRPDADSVRPGDVLRYLLTVTNHGPDAAQDVVLTDQVPPELTAVEYSFASEVGWHPWTGTVTIGVLAADENRDLMIRGTVGPSANGSLTNTATLHSPTDDPDPKNNTSTVVTQIIPPAPPTGAKADLSVTKRSDAVTVRPGDVISYLLSVANHGPDAALGVVLMDQIPEGLTGAEYLLAGDAAWHPWTDSVTIGALTANETRDLVIRGTVSPSASGSLTNTATLHSPTDDPNPNNNTSTVVTQITPPAPPTAAKADLSVTKRADAENVRPGDVLSYLLTVVNHGPDAAQDVVLTDQIPAGLTGAEYLLAGDAAWHPWTGTVTIGALTANETRDLVIRGTVSPSASGSLTNTATLHSPTDDPDPKNNTSTVVTKVTPPAPPTAAKADLSVTKRADAENVRPGDVLSYLLTVTNRGPDAAQDVVLTDQVPAALTAVEYSFAGETGWHPWTGTVTIGALTANESRDLMIRGTIAPSANGSLTNTATLHSPTDDPDPKNNTSTVVTKVTPPTPVGADLSIRKEGRLFTVATGKALIYTIVVTNSGPGAAQNVTVTDQLPPGLTTPEYSTDNSATWQAWPGTYTIASLAANTTKTILIRGLLNATAAGTLTNTATVKSPTPDPKPGNNTTTVVTPIPPGADIGIIKTANPVQAAPCDTVVYTIRVFNNGPATATNVVIKDVLSGAICNPVYSMDGGATWQPWYDCASVGDLPPGAGATLLISGVVHSRAKQDIVNCALVVSPTPDPNSSNNSAAAVIKINRQ